MSKRFMVSVHAKPPADFPFEGGSVAGYYQTLGITAKNESELIQIIREHLRKDLGASLVEIDEVWVPDFEGSEADIAEQCTDTGKIGIWYASGHAFFPPESEHEKTGDEE